MSSTAETETLLVMNLKKCFENYWMYRFLPLQYFSFITNTEIIFQIHGRYSSNKRFSHETLQKTWFFLHHFLFQRECLNNYHFSWYNLLQIHHCWYHQDTIGIQDSTDNLNMRKFLCTFVILLKQKIEKRNKNSWCCFIASCISSSINVIAQWYKRIVIMLYYN